MSLAEVTNSQQENNFPSDFVENLGARYNTTIISEIRSKDPLIHQKGRLDDMNAAYLMGCYISGDNRGLKFSEFIK